jgi:ABC-type uncharacterized transport system involved in gliding motility auxiliary subunit
MKLSQRTFLILQILLFFVLSNLVLSYISCRKDISKSERLTLAKSTKEKLKSLSAPLYIDAFYSSDLPIEYNVRLELIKEFLMEVEKENPGMIHLTFFDPSGSAEVRKKAIEAGLFPNEIQKSSETSKSFQEAYMGIIVKYDFEVEIISDFFFVEEAETQFTRTLRRINQRRKIQTVGIVKDKGTLETPVPGRGSGVTTWGVFYHQAFPEEYGKAFDIFLNEENIPSQIKVLLIVGSPEWNEIAKQRLDDFLIRGGRVIFLLNSMQFSVTAIRNKDGLAFGEEKLAIPSLGFSHWKDLLEFYGFEIGTNLLFDFEHPVSLSKINVAQKHYYPFWHYFYKSEGNLHQNHVLTNNVDLLILPWLSSLKIVRTIQPDLEYEVILSTDRQVWKKENVFSMKANQSFSESEIERSRIPIGILAQGKIKSRFENQYPSHQSKIFVLSSSFFISDVLSLPEFRSTYRDSNVSFLLNVIDLMLDDSGYIFSREKKVAVFPLKTFTNQEKNIYSFFNILFLPFVFILFAVRRVQKRYSGNRI